MLIERILALSVLGFTLKVIINAVAGAFLLWVVELDDDFEFSFGKITAKIPHEFARFLVQGFLFVGFGTYVALLFAHPETARQAFTAGIGWTASVNSVSGRVRRSSTRRKPPVKKSTTTGEKKAKATSVGKQ